MKIIECKRGELGEEKRLARPFSAKSTDDTGSFEGLGAVFDDVHPTSSWRLPSDWNDVIRPGAFAATLADSKKLGALPSMLWMHQRGDVIGAWRTAEETKDGLKVTGQVSLNAKTASDVGIHELLKMGAVTGLSIGFGVTKYTLDEEQKLREILALDLSEVSIVDSPGISTARITDVKQLRDPRFLEQFLRDAGFSRKEAKAFIASGLGALREAAADDDQTQRDAGEGGGSAWLSSIVERARKLNTP